MWKLEPEDEYLKQRKWYEKKRAKELEAVEANLKRFLMALQAGAKPQNIVGKWASHNEGFGVRALDQTGPVKGKLAATRLYIFADEETEILHVITLGDKQSQGEQVQYCKQWVRSLQEAKARPAPDKVLEKSEPDG